VSLDFFSERIEENGDDGTRNQNLTKGFHKKKLSRSPATPKGMPAEYEEFADDPETYIVINVPPTLTFKANVLGKRVCAIYKKVGDAE
jgi:hypothetical protein